MRYVVRFFSFLFSTFFSLSAIALIGILGLYSFYAPQLPDGTDLHKIKLQVPLRIYSKDEQLIAEYGAKRRRPVTFSQIPPRLHQAFIAIEDTRYYEHRGVDFKGIVRALHSALSSGRISQGASTITMQLARNAFLSREKTLTRKLKETVLALKLERSLSKEDILELYLNKIYLGNRAYGIAAAARIYYGKEKLAELSLAQMAMIAGLPKAPSRYNPIVNPQRAMIRRDYILKRMFELGYINRADYEAAVMEDNTARVHKPEIEAYAPYLAEMVRAAIVEKYQDKAYTQGYHVYTTLDANIQQHAVSALRKSLVQYDLRHGYRGPEDHINLDEYNDPEAWLDKLATYSDVADMRAALVIRTSRKQAELLLLNEQMNGQTVTLNLNDMTWARPFINADRRGPKPQRVNQVLKPGNIIRVRQTEPAAKDPSTQHTENATANQSPTWQLAQIPDVGGALVVMDPENGALRAVMGGFDYYRSQFNRATQARRQPGSGFKPIVYAAAMSKGFTPASIINDAPIPGTRENWQPKNFGGGYVGPTTLAEALAKSRNLVSIRLLRNIGIPYTIDYAMRFGYTQKDLPPNLTLSLGTGLATPVQMATAYAAFANGGFKIEPHFINRIEDSHGELLYDAGYETQHACGDKVDYCPDSATPAAKRIMDPRTNQQIISMMHGVTRFGTAAHAGKILQRKDIAGKTGTTNDQRDSWFCGFTPEYVAVAWAGFDDMAELGNKENATKIALPMWTDLMQNILRDRPEQSWKQYDGTRQIADSDVEKILPTEPAQRFEYTSAPLATQNAQQQQTGIELIELPGAAGQQQSIQQPAAPKAATAQPQSEAVEIPEQIF